MYALITDLEKLKRMVRRGSGFAGSDAVITAKRYRFLVAPLYGEALRAGLMQWGVPPCEAEDMEIIETAICDVGEVMMVDKLLLDGPREGVAWSEIHE